MASIMPFHPFSAYKALIERISLMYIMGSKIERERAQSLDVTFTDLINNPNKRLDHKKGFVFDYLRPIVIAPSWLLRHWF